LSQKQNNSNNELQQQGTSNTKDTNFGSPPQESSITGNRRDCELSGTKWIHRNLFDTISLNIKKNCHYNSIINSSWYNRRRQYKFWQEKEKEKEEKEKEENVRWRGR